MNVPLLTLSLTPRVCFNDRLNPDQLGNWRWKQNMAVVMVPEETRTREEGSCRSVIPPPVQQSRQSWYWLFLVFTFIKVAKQKLNLRTQRGKLLMNHFSKPGCVESTSKNMTHLCCLQSRWWSNDLLLSWPQVLKKKVLPAELRDRWTETDPERERITGLFHGGRGSLI